MARLAILGVLAVVCLPVCPVWAQEKCGFVTLKQCLQDSCQDSVETATEVPTCVRKFRRRCGRQTIWSVLSPTVFSYLCTMKGYQHFRDFGPCLSRKDIFIQINSCASGMLPRRFDIAQACIACRCAGKVAEQLCGHMAANFMRRIIADERPGTLERHEQGDCQSNPCQNDGTCRVTSWGYECVCAPHSNGTNCEMLSLSGTCWTPQVVLPIVICIFVVYSLGVIITAVCLVKKWRGTSTQPVPQNERMIQLSSRRDEKVVWNGKGAANVTPNLPSEKYGSCSPVYEDIVLPPSGLSPNRPDTSASRPPAPPPGGKTDYETLCHSLPGGTLDENGEYEMLGKDKL